MNDHVICVAVCVECHGFAEPPLTRVYDPYGLPTRFFICQTCREAITHPDDDLPELGGEGG